VGLLAVILLFCGVLLIRNCSKSDSPAYEYIDDGQDYTALLHLPNPKWSRFVRITKNDVKLYKNPDENGIFLMRQWECFNADIYYWSNEQPKEEWSTDDVKFDENKILPLDGEEDNYYKVIAIASSGESFVKGYIRKDCCEIVQPAPVTEELLSDLRKGYYSYMMVTEGEYKGLCLEYSYPDLEGYDALSLGVRASQYCVIFSESCGIGTRFEESYHGAPYLNREHGYATQMAEYVTRLIYGPANRGDDPLWESRDAYEMLNVKSLTPGVIKEIYSKLTPVPEGYININYYFPEVSKDNVCKFWVEADKFKKWLEESNMSDSEDSNS
jgi:hypothetical protein